MGKKWVALLAASVMMTSLLFSSCSPSGPSKNDVQLSEIMAKNNGILADNDGEYPDWIELHNPTDKAINLENYSLTDDARKKGKFVFPAITIEPGNIFSSMPPVKITRIWRTGLSICPTASILKMKMCICIRRRVRNWDTLKLEICRKT